MELFPQHRVERSIPTERPRLYGESRKTNALEEPFRYELSQARLRLRRLQAEVAKEEALLTEHGITALSTADPRGDEQLASPREHLEDPAPRRTLYLWMGAGAFECPPCPSFLAKSLPRGVA